MKSASKLEKSYKTIYVKTYELKKIMIKNILKNHISFPGGRKNKLFS